MARKPPPVLGHDLPGPKVTAAGWALAALWCCPPALAVVVVADLIGWAAARALFDVCFGVVCLLG